MPDLERIKADARLASTTDYGYPLARKRCAAHVLELVHLAESSPDWPTYSGDMMALALSYAQ